MECIILNLTSLIKWCLKFVFNNFRSWSPVSPSCGIFIHIVSKSLLVVFFILFISRPERCKSFWYWKIQKFLMEFIQILMFPLPTFLIEFFFIGIHSIQGWTATTRHGVTSKRSTIRLQLTGNLFRKNLQLKDICYF